MIQNRSEGAPLLRVQDLQVQFPIRSSFLRKEIGRVRAVNGISFDIAQGQIMGLVGESGCGKTTAGRAVLGLTPPTGGRVLFDGADASQLRGEGQGDLRRQMQLVYQDPYASLNPRLTVGQAIAEPIRFHRLRASPAEIRDRRDELMGLVGLNPEFASRYPHEFSGGQRQRIGIARALAVEPRFLVCDEAVSALDVSVQAQIINLLQDLRDRLGLTYLFIAHGLAVVKHISDRVAIMYMGRIVESAATDALYAHPRHPYTRALLSAAPIPDPDLERDRRRIVLKGDLPSPLSTPSGCPFASRCPMAVAHCRETEPPLQEKVPGHMVACWRADEVAHEMRADIPG